MTTEQNGNIAPVAKNPQAQGTRDLAARAQDGMPNARWGMRRLGVAGACVLLAAGTLKCGGEAGPTNVEPTETPSGVCSDLQGRIIRIGTTTLALNEAALSTGMSVKLGGEEYSMKVVAVTASGALCKIVDSEGNVATNVQDQDGNSIGETFFATLGGSWKVTFADGREILVTLCGLIADETGKLYAVFESDGFYWCTTVNEDVNARETFGSGYGVEVITRVLHREGQTRDRDEAQCTDIAEDLVKETAQLETPIMPGVQEYDHFVKVLGNVWDVVTLSNDGYLVLANSEVSGKIEVGETLPSPSTGITVTLNEVSLYGDEYMADFTVKVNGVTFTVMGGATKGELVEVTYTDASGTERTALVRLNEVNADGTARFEILVDSFKLVDGGVLVDAEGNVWSVELSKNGGELSNGVDGWVLTLM